jgi:hypothetical protein
MMPCPEVPSMRLIAATLMSVSLAASQVAPANKPAGTSPRPAKQYTMEQFLDTTSIQGASFSADESRLLFSSNKTGIWNAYTIATGGGAWTPVTTSTKDSTYAVSFFPHDNRVLSRPASIARRSICTSSLMPPASSSR